MKDSLLERNPAFAFIMLFFIAFSIYFVLNATFIAIIMEKFRIITLHMEGTQTGPTEFRKMIGSKLEKLKSIYQKVKGRFGGKKEKSR